MSGSSRPAEEESWSSSPPVQRSVRPLVQPIFDVLGRQTLWLRARRRGSRLKLALNNWLAVFVEGMVETLTLSEALGLDSHLLLNTIAGGPLNSDYAITKGAAMLNAEFVPRLPTATCGEGRRTRLERRTPTRSRTPADECAAAALARSHRQGPRRRRHRLCRHRRCADRDANG